jgi:CDP-glycerol glycerophosphotransferase (TagB/SpsB family)
MGDVFKKSYGATEEEILYLGFPRTDYLLKASKEEQQTQKILYLPTYRKDNMPNLVADVLFLREKLPVTTELIIKIHPTTTLLDAGKLTAVKGVRLVQQNQGADDLLLVADCLITDYSSVAFDYALINKQGKLVFYWFDEEEYEKETGIQQIFKETLPYKVVSTIEEVALSIEESQDDLSAFNEVWNTYNDGESTKRLLQWIKEKMDGN